MPELEGDEVEPDRVELGGAEPDSPQVSDAQLRLSPRTVDSHLAKAFRKLDISRRAALSLALLEQASEPDPMIEDFAEA